jgi:2-polyprenyl-6-methoxyphenol hydroxylase-like FAD-dependent oxidoreductase
MLLSQPRLEKILHAALARKGCVVEKGIELISFEQFPDCVNVKLVKRRGERFVQEQRRYEWMVGADGEAPVICKHLGLQFFGNVTKTTQLLVGDIRVDGLPPNVRHYYSVLSNLIHRLSGCSLGICGEIHLELSECPQLVVCVQVRNPAQCEPTCNRKS